MILVIMIAVSLAPRCNTVRVIITHCWLANYLLAIPASIKSQDAFRVPPVFTASAVILTSQAKTLKHGALLSVSVVKLSTSAEAIFEVLVVRVSLGSRLRMYRTLDTRRWIYP